MKDSIS